MAFDLPEPRPELPPPLGDVDDSINRPPRFVERKLSSPVLGVITAGQMRSLDDTVGINLGQMGGIPTTWTKGINFENTALPVGMTVFINFDPTASPYFLKNPGLEVTLLGAITTHVAILALNLGVNSPGGMQISGNINYNLSPFVGFSSLGTLVNSISWTGFGAGGINIPIAVVATDVIGFRFTQPGGLGSATNIYGLYIDPVTAGTVLNYSIYTNAGEVSFGAKVTIRAGKLTTVATAVGGAGLLVPHGTAPAAPVDGDVWTTTLGLYARINGVTVGPYGVAGGGTTATTVEVNLGATAIFTGKFTITDAAIGAASKVLVWQAPGPYTGKGARADEASLQPVNVTAVEPAVGSAVVRWETPPMIVEASISAGNQPITSLRLGRVRGNVKFSYLVLA